MDTLYLVFKHRFQLYWIAVQTTKTRPKQTGSLTDHLSPVKAALLFAGFCFPPTKTPPFSFNFRREKRHLQMPFCSLPVNTRLRAKGHYREIELIVNGRCPSPRIDASILYVLRRLNERNQET